MVWLLIIIVVLWILGGWEKAHWSGFRDILIPIILGTVTIWLLKADIVYKLIIGILTIGTANIIRLGYGNFEPQDQKQSLLADIWASFGVKDTQGALIRASWGLIVGLALPLITVVYTHNWLGWGLYIGINTLIGFLVSKLRLPVLLCDIIVAIGVWTYIPIFLN